MQERATVPAVLLGLALAFGLAVGGWFIGHGLLRARATDRYVSVKGFAEREVAADLALWPVVFTVTADDLAALQKRFDEAAAKIQGYLAGQFTDEEVGVSSPRIVDRLAAGMIDPNRPLDRYVAEGAVTVRTAKIEAVREAMERSGELVAQGVPLIRSYEYTTQYLFTRLDEIKPEMIAEATKDARRAAEQFALDSGSRVGAIRNAQQGLFSVEDRDPFSPERKKVRVVTTVQYLLED